MSNESETPVNEEKDFMRNSNLHLRMLLGFLAGFAAVIVLLRAQDGAPAEEHLDEYGNELFPGAAPAGDLITPAVLAPAEGAGNIIKRLGDFVPRNHLLQKRFDAQMSAVAWTNFVTSLDFDRSYFLQSDIDRFAEMRDRFGEVLRSGDTAWAYDVFAVYKERLAERYGFVTNLLEQGMDFSTAEFYEWNRRHAAWPATEEERDDLWRRKIKNEYLGIVIARELDQEAASNRVAKASNNEQVITVNGKQLRLVARRSSYDEELRKLEKKLQDVLDMRDFIPLEAEKQVWLVNGRHKVSLREMTDAGMLLLKDHTLENAWTMAPETVTMLRGVSREADAAVRDWTRVTIAAIAEHTEAMKEAAKEEPPAPDAEATEETAEAQIEKPARPPVTPEESIAKNYRQRKTVMEDYHADFVLQRFASALVSAYDPHSDYMSPAKVEDFENDMRLSLQGIGAMLRPEDGAAKVMELIPGGPAARDTRDIRLRENDLIIGVGQGDGEIEDVMHLPLDKTVRKIRGKEGTKVVLQVISGSDPSGTDIRLIDLIRDVVKLEDQAATSRVERVVMPDGTTRTLGVVRLPAFYRSFDKPPGAEGFRSSTEDVAREIAKLNNEDIEGLILDLRNNGGGALAEAVDLAALFVKSGPVVQVREPKGIQVLPIPETGVAGPMFRKPMVVLVNRTSASASEIVAGALQDYGRAIVVGDSKTHGKGTVQTVLKLAGRFGDDSLGSAKLTTATFYRITGASTQLRGVVPDIVIPSTLDAMEIGEEFLPNPLPWTTLDAAFYTPVFSLAEVVPALRERSAQRLADDEKYQRYHRLIEHLARTHKEAVIPLERAARKAHVIEEREARKLQDLESDEPAETEEEDVSPRRKKQNPADDTIMQEALKILSDLITQTDGREVPLSTGDNMQRSMFRIFGGF